MIKSMQSTGADWLVVVMRSGKLDGAKGLSRSAFNLNQPKGRRIMRTRNRMI
jgi:hypothetical protein